ncbi:MAG TPA: DNA alkylation repair protein [Microthrixaceae bacterium]|nr:DNA alkylation repair protein [Microthrixaceae bacterium]
MADDLDGPIDSQVRDALDWLQRHASDEIRDSMGTRFGIHTNHAFGVSMADMKRLARQLGPSHELAAGLWSTQLYEARTVAAMVEEPARVTSAQMDRWCRDFDNWAICDTVCFNLFDRVPHAWPKVEKWSSRPEEFVKRGAFALLWSLALHDKHATDDQFVDALVLAEREAVDERPMVKKSIIMALNAIGTRGDALKAAAVDTAQHLSDSQSAAARGVGRAALGKLSRR